MNKRYLVSVSLMTFVIPLAGFLSEHYLNNATFAFNLFAKWFIFSAVGLRLFIAGIMQSLNPAFTAKQIFHIDTPKVFPIVRELGFANICFGITGIITLFKPEWRIVSAFASCIYYGFAGFQHLVKKPVGVNEAFALWTDLVIFGVLLAFLVVS